MKKVNIILLTVISLMFSCNEEISMEELKNNPDAGVRTIMKRDKIVQNKKLPFKAAFETISVPLSGPPNQQQKITGTGQASHLGKATFEALSTVIFTHTPPFTLNGTSFMTAANGDIIYTTFTGTSAPQENAKLLVTIKHSIIGGTGRFSNANGHFTGTTLAEIGNPAGFIELEGFISY